MSVTKMYWALPAAESWLSAEDTAQTQKGTTPRSDLRKREEFWVEPRTSTPWGSSVKLHV